jgi:hypothetical protein
VSLWSGWKVFKGENRQKARDKRQETRGKRQEARGKRQEARDKRQKTREPFDAISIKNRAHVRLYYSLCIFISTLKN